MAPLTKEELNRLTYTLRSIDLGKLEISGSWETHTYNQRKRYFRRGPLLIEYNPNDLLNSVVFWVIVPHDGQVLPKDMYHIGDIFPTLGDGVEAIRIYLNDEGPWWDLIRREIDGLREEYQALDKRRRQEEVASRQKREDERQSKLASATASVQAYLKHGG